VSVRTVLAGFKACPNLQLSTFKFVNECARAAVCVILKKQKKHHLCTTYKGGAFFVFVKIKKAP
jgi:hypothetical protein